MMADAALRARLEHLARLHDLSPGHTDGLGTRVNVSDDALLRLLRCLGAPVVQASEIQGAIDVRTRALCARLIEPTVALFDDEPAALTIRLPERAAGHVDVHLELEDKSEIRAVSDLNTLESASTPSTRLPGVQHVTVPLLERPPLGHHTVVVSYDGRSSRAHLVCAPARAHQPDLRTWGAFLPLYALRTARSPAAGDFTDLQALVNWTADRDGRVVGTLPLHPVFLDGPMEPSPYAPVTRLGWNECYVDPERTEEFATCARTRAHIRACLGELSEMASRSQIHYERLYRIKRRMLSHLADRYFAQGDLRALARFAQAHPHIERYAQFRATMVAEGSSWSEWPAAQRDGQLDPATWAESARRMHLYAQWQAATQLDAVASRAESKGSSLYLDVPVGVHPDGYDAWQEQGQFLRGCAVGAPPDSLFAHGQDWGFAPLDPGEPFGTGLDYFARCVRHQMGPARLLRIDHVMGMHRLYCIPHGMSAREGAYVRYPARALYATLTLASSRHGTALVGEDLGTVPDVVRTTMKQRGLLRMHVVPIELEKSVRGVGRALDAPADSLATLNTHDMPTFAAFVGGHDLDLRHGLGFLRAPQADAARIERTRVVSSLSRALGCAPDARALLHHVLGRLAAGETPLLLVNLEDLWLEQAPQNVPGTTTEHPNWRRRAAHALEAVDPGQDLRALLGSRGARSRCTTDG